MRRLNVLVVKGLLDSGLDAVGMPGSMLFVTRNDVIETALLDTLFEALEAKLVPVLCGDAVFDRGKTFTILSGDTIATYLIKRLGGKRLVFAVDVDGVYGQDRETGERRLITELTPKLHTSLLYYPVDDVTGGMFGKVEDGFDAVEAGAEVLFVNGLTGGRVEAALKGEPVIGTRLMR